MKRALITGAAGFIGSRLARALRAEEIEVSAVVRRQHDTNGLEEIGANLFRGDARDPGLITEAAEGCDVIFHLAAARGPHKLSGKEYREQNLQLTDAVVAASLAAPGRRLVAASTAAVLGRGPGRRTEESRPRPNSGYRASRLHAERRLAEAGRETGLDYVVARLPQAVMGPGARAWVRRFRPLLDGRPRFIPMGGTLHSGDVDDVVDALRLCGTVEGIRGETFLLGAEDPIPVRRILDIAAGELGVKFDPLELPAWPFRLYASLGDVARRIMDLEPPHHYTAEFYTGRFAFDIGKARRRIGYQPRYSIEESVLRTIRSLRAEGLL